MIASLFSDVCHVPKSRAAVGEARRGIFITRWTPLQRSVYGLSPSGELPDGGKIANSREFPES
jgi:hypothetical protein